jgi:hypothetical protein
VFITPREKERKKMDVRKLIEKFATINVTPAEFVKREFEAYCDMFYDGLESTHLPLPEAREMAFAAVKSQWGWLWEGTTMETPIDVAPETEIPDGTYDVLAKPRPKTSNETKLEREAALVAEGYLPPSYLGDKLGLSPYQTNLKLQDLGLQRRVEDSDGGNRWTPTSDGSKYCRTIFPSRAAKPGAYTLFWDAKAIRKLIAS